MSLIIREVEKRLPTRESDSLVAQTMKSLPAIRETRNPMDGGAWQATIHEVEKSRTNHLLESDMIFINLLYQY